jgi:hypothetical protein
MPTDNANCGIHDKFWFTFYYKTSNNLNWFLNVSKKKKKCLESWIQSALICLPGETSRGGMLNFLHEDSDTIMEFMNAEKIK